MKFNLTLQFTIYRVIIDITCLLVKLVKLLYIIFQLLMNFFVLNFDLKDVQLNVFILLAHVKYCICAVIISYIVLTDHYHIL